MTGDHVREKLHSIRGWYPISIDVWIRDGFRCVYCDADLLATVDAYRYGWAHDHLIPRSISPDDSPSNIVLACSACNSFKL